jgi:hypothetical protein
MAGLDPAIHDDAPDIRTTRVRLQDCFMDLRVKPGGDAVDVAPACLIDFAYFADTRRQRMRR